MTDKTPLGCAKSACDTMIRRYEAALLPPVKHFHYHQGVFLSGMYETYLLCGNGDYFDYIRSWMDSVIDENGRILKYDHADLDDIQPGILLYPLLDKTGDARYRKALDSVLAQVPDVPRNAEGGFWHKKHLKDQMWLDGLYMAGPFLAEYAARFGRPELRELVIKQALLMEQKTRDPVTGLLYHAWDASKTAGWADPGTGRAPEFWGRSVGWVPVALLDDLTHIDEDAPGFVELKRFATGLLQAVCRYQSADGRWYQVVNKPEEEGNWLENSCSSLFTAALARAVRKGYMPPEHAKNARKGFAGVLNDIAWDGGDILIGNVCIGTEVGGYEYYRDRPVAVNDLHGVGAFLLMCAEMHRLESYLNSQADSI